MIRRFISCLLLAASLPAIAAQKYDVDTNHTYVTFTYNHLGFSNPIVHLEKITADFQLDTADLTKSSIAVTLPLEGLHTGVAKLDDDLKSPNFFDAAKYPEITFKSSKVEKTGADGVEDQRRPDRSRRDQAGCPERQGQQDRRQPDGQGTVSRLRGGRNVEAFRLRRWQAGAGRRR